MGRYSRCRGNDCGRRGNERRVPPTLRYTDRARIISYNDTVHYASINSGEGGFSPDAFDGKYAIIGLDDDRGPLRPEAFFFLGEQPSGPDYQRALDRIETFGRNTFPYTGYGVLSRRNRPDGRGDRIGRANPPQAPVSGSELRPYTIANTFRARHSPATASYFTSATSPPSSA